VFNAVNDTTPQTSRRKNPEALVPRDADHRSLGAAEAPLSNRKAREVLGFKEDTTGGNTFDGPSGILNWRRRRTPLHQLHIERFAPDGPVETEIHFDGALAIATIGWTTVCQRGSESAPSGRRHSRRWRRRAAPRSPRARSQSTRDQCDWSTCTGERSGVGRREDPVEARFGRRASLAVSYIGWR